MEYDNDLPTVAEVADDQRHSRQMKFLQAALQRALQNIKTLQVYDEWCASQSNRLRVGFQSLAEVLDLLDRRYGPVHGDIAPDLVAGIKLSSLIEEVFRSHIESSNQTAVALRMELECCWVDWFPQRLRQILQNLVFSSLRLRDISKGESRVTIVVRKLYQGYELRITDNVIETDSTSIGRESMHRHLSNSGGGLPVVKMLLEESDSDLIIQSSKGHGTTAIAVLPQFAIGDFLESPFPVATEQMV
jgi:signal transduction histidine kinase